MGSCRPFALSALGVYKLPALVRRAGTYCDGQAPSRLFHPCLTEGDDLRILSPMRRGPSSATTSCWRGELADAGRYPAIDIRKIHQARAAPMVTSRSTWSWRATSSKVLLPTSKSRDLCHRQVMLHSQGSDPASLIGHHPETYLDQFFWQKMREVIHYDEGPVTPCNW